MSSANRSAQPPSRPRGGAASNEERYRLVVECVRDYAIFMLDPSGAITTWNLGAQTIKGWTEAEILGRHFSVFYPDEDIAAGKPAWELREATRTGRFEDEGWRLRKDGSRFWANVVITALRDGSGALVGFGKVTRDLTERKHAEDLRIQLARAEEAVKVRDHLVTTLSHELRNPLAPIQNALGVLQRAEPGSAPARRALAVAQRQVALLGDIVEDLLDVGRLVKGTLQVGHAPVDLAGLVRAVAEDHRGPLDERGVALEVKAASALWVEGDRTRLQQILANLLQNARKFTPRGGHVVVSAQAVQGRAEVRVRDDGVGLDPEMAARLFQPFVQADRTLARSRGGLGLGLALVKGFTELHGGRVSVASAGPGQGAEFTVSLPLAPGAADAPPPPGASGDRRARRVLVVDDNTDAAESLADMLRLLGHEVEVALDGPGALAAADRRPPDVVLCDLGLPEMDGYEVARRLRSRPELSATLLVALSGYAGEDDVRRAVAAGFDRHLAKPADPFDVERLVG